jgi:hypothetical protein
MRIASAAGFLTILATFATPAHAQIGSNETSIAVGLVSSTLAGEDADNVSSKIGFIGEIQLVHPLNRRIGIQTGAGIIQKGSHLSLTQVGGDDSSLNLSYLEVPAMLRIGFAGRYSEIRPAIFFGPAASLNVGCKYKVPTQGGGSIESDCEPDGPQIKAYDFSLVAGAGAEFGAFGAFARYDHGFVSIDNSGAGDKVYNRAIIVGVTWNNSAR